LVEYWEDRFENDPHAVLETLRGEDGEIVFEDLEDPLLAKWEKELAAGVEPDLEEGLSDAEKEKLRKGREKATGKAGPKADELVINDDFTKPGTKPSKQFDSKFVPVGSDEERLMSAAAVLGRQRSNKAGLPTTLGGGLKRRGR
jgi:hypothetical protein